MKHVKFVMFGLIAALTLGLPGPAEAQQSDGWWQWALREVTGVRTGSVGPVILDRDGNGKVGDRRDRDDRADRRGGTLEDIILGRRTGEDRDDRYEDRDRRDRQGPPFCRNGQGHPVHGQSWCRDKGFGDYGDYGRTARWEDRGWEDIILGAPRDRDRRSGVVDRGGLIDILGDVVFGRLDRERQRMGGGTPLQGRWLDLSNGGSVLQLRSGSLPVAELTDLDGDRRVDVTLMPRR